MLIWISGPTGSGKTSLSEIFKNHGYALVAEQLPQAMFAAFSLDPLRHCAKLQEQIIQSRFDCWTRLSTSSRIVFDRSIDEDINIFCQLHLELGFLTENEFLRLKELANTLQRSMPEPDLIVFMSPSLEALSSRITISSHPEVIVETLGRQVSLYSKWLQNKAREILVVDNSKCGLSTMKKLLSGFFS